MKEMLIINEAKGISILSEKEANESRMYPAYYQKPNTHNNCNINTFKLMLK